MNWGKATKTVAKQIQLFLGSPVNEDSEVGRMLIENLASILANKPPREVLSDLHEVITLELVAYEKREKSKGRASSPTESTDPEFIIKHTTLGVLEELFFFY